jgi:hypothetical protein
LSSTRRVVPIAEPSTARSGRATKASSQPIERAASSISVETAFGRAGVGNGRQASIGELVDDVLGVAGVWLADAFLGYPEGYAKPLILLIEVPMLLTIALALGLLVAGPPERAAGSS